MHEHGNPNTRFKFFYPHTISAVIIFAIVLSLSLIWNVFYAAVWLLGILAIGFISHHAEKRLNEKTDKLNAIFAALPDSCFCFKPDGSIIGYRAGQADALCLPLNGFTGKPVADLLPPEAGRQYMENIDRIIKGEKQICFEYELPIAGGKRYFEARLVSLMGKNILGFVRDITLSKTAEQDLREAEKQVKTANIEKTRFLANMNHEIRTPLNTVIGFSQILLEMTKEFSLPKDFEKYVENISAAGEKLLELIGDILELSRTGSGGMDINEEDFSLKNMIKTVYKVYEPEALKKGIDYTYSLDPVIPDYIRSDRSKLIRILSELIANAIKFTPEKKKVSIDVKKEKDNISFTVLDQGIGIPKDKQELIFKPFLQADESTCRRFEGAGLGLALSMGIVGRLGGTISVVSEKGAGSNFKVLIPLKEAVPPLADKQVDGEQRSETSKVYEFSGKSVVLLVDDDPMNQTLTQFQFKSMGMEVVFADNGQEGIDKTFALKPDLILMDIHLPVMDGMEAARQIRRDPEFAHTPIIALSADAFSEQKKKALDAGMNGYLTKPLDFDKLVAVLNKYSDISRKGSGRLEFGNVDIDIPGARGRKEAIADDAPLVKQPVAHRDLSPLHILVVEDNKKNLLIIKAFLKQTPYRLDSAENGEIGVKKFMANKYDLVLMDIQMPVMDGNTATAAIRKWEKQKSMEPTPVIALSANAFEEQKQKSFEAGCDYYLTKPINKTVLLEVIGKYANDS